MSRYDDWLTNNKHIEDLDRAEAAFRDTAEYDIAFANYAESFELSPQYETAFHDWLDAWDDDRDGIWPDDYPDNYQPLYTYDFED